MFSEQEKRVYGPYRYGDGDKTLYADPLAVNRKVKALLGGDVEQVVRDYNSGEDVLVERAAARFLGAVVEAFGLKPFDPKTGTGLVEAHVVQVWNHFQDWLAQKKTSGPDTATSFPPSPAAPVRSLPRAPQPKAG
jgi:hypothetical protein